MHVKDLISYHHLSAVKHDVMLQHMYTYLSEKEINCHEYVKSTQSNSGTLIPNHPNNIYLIYLLKYPLYSIC
jgi:hypothetical protein